MKKFLFLFMFILLLVGCEQKSIQKKQPSETKISSKEKVEVFVGFSFSESEFKLSNTLTKPEDINTLKQSIKNAKKMDGILDVLQPQHKINVYDGKGLKKSYFLWINKESKFAMYMPTNDTHYGYKISEKDTELLKGIIFQKDKTQVFVDRKNGLELVAFINKTSFQENDEIKIEATLKNTSGKDITYHKGQDTGPCHINYPIINIRNDKKEVYFISKENYINPSLMGYACTEMFISEIFKSEETFKRNVTFVQKKLNNSSETFEFEEIKKGEYIVEFSFQGSSETTTFQLPIEIK